MHLRLTVFGANDDQGRVEDMLILELGNDFSDGLVGMVQGIQQGKAWGSRCICVPCSHECLSYTHRLETHPEDSWNHRLAGAGVILAVNLVYDRLHFQVVIGLGMRNG